MAVRKPHVAGSFYPADPDELQQYGQAHLVASKPQRDVRAMILPHAGYMYSGHTACQVLAQTNIPNRNLLIGPDHFAAGGDFSVFSEGVWQTPLGSVEVDSSLTKNLCKPSAKLREDAGAHQTEHSLEVLVPLLQMKVASFKIAPVLIGTLNPEKVREAAIEVGNQLKQEDTKPLVVISNDMNHYESDSVTRQKDRYALDAIANLDGQSLVKAVRQYRISMCGFGPVYFLLNMIEALRIEKATLVDYRTSAEVSGDYDRVVGYAGFIFE